MLLISSPNYTLLSTEIAILSSGNGVATTEVFMNLSPSPSQALPHNKTGDLASCCNGTSRHLSISPTSVISYTLKTMENSILYSKNVTHTQIPTSSIINASVTVLPPTVTVTNHHSTDLLFYVGIPVAITAFIVFLVLSLIAWRWYKRKKRLERDFTPCYTYDHSENDVMDGVLYPSGVNSVDLLCVDASPIVPRRAITSDVGDGDVEDDDDNDDKSCLLTDRRGNNNEMDDFASDTIRCGSVAV